MSKIRCFLMRIISGYLIAGWFALGFIQSPRAQQLPVDRLSSEQGLSQNMILALCQDSKGFIWAGTKDGLNRFDGYRFQVYRFDPFDTLSISDNYIRSILEDREGRMWVNTANGLNLFDRAKEIFYRVSPTLVPASYSLSEDSQGNLWLTGIDRRLIKIELPPGRKNLEGLEVRIFMPDSISDSTGVKAENLYSPFVDKSGVWWTVHNPSIPAERFYLNNDRQSYRSSKDFSDVPYTNFRRILEGRHNCFIALGKGLDSKIWIGAGDSLLCWDSRRGRFDCYRIFHTSNQYLWDNRWPMAAVFLEDHRNRLWIGGAVRHRILDLKTGEVTDCTQLPESDPLFYGISAMLEDQGGVIWLGTRGNGLIKFNDNARRFANPDNDPGLWEGASLRGIGKTSDGRIWLGTTDIDILWLERQKKSIKKVLPKKLNAITYRGTAYCFYQSEPDVLWIGTETNFIKLTNCRSDDPDAVEILIDSSLARQKIPHYPAKIISDGKGGMWLACVDALRHFNPATGSFSTYPFFNGDLDKIKSNLFPTIYKDDQGFIWLGLTEGLWRFDPASHTFRKYRNDPNDPTSIRYNLVKTIAADPREPDRYLWIGTGGGGLNRFDMETGSFDKFTEKDGLADRVVYGILSDEVGNLWMSTNKGISVFNPQTRSFRNFDTTDGLQDLEFNSASYFKAPDGQLFFGGIKGFNAFYPDRMLKTNNHIPPIVITDFKIANKSVSIKDPGSVLKSAIPYTPKIVLPHDVKIISFEFAALDFAAPAKNQFACKMEGFDADWQYLGAVHSVTYTNLDPGTYTFRVKGSNNDGVWNETGTAVEIIILPPWWATWWAYLLYFIVIAGVIYAFLHLQMKRNRDRAEASRLKELNEVKSIFLSTVSHELRTPLTSIMGFSKIIKKRMIERILPQTNLDDPRVERAAHQVMDNLDIVVSESERLTHLINDVLDLAKIEAGKVTWQYSPVDMGDVIERAIGATSTLFDTQEIKIEKVVEPQLPAIYGDKDRLIQVVVNLLSNAAKFTEKGRVRCTARMQQNQVVVQISDTGIGIAAKDLHHIFEKFKQVGDDTLTDKPMGTGLGLPICKEIVEHHGGRIWVESEIGTGSVFSFSLPVTTGEIKHS